MKTPGLLLFLVGWVLSTRAMAEPSPVTPAQAVERTPQALIDLRGALEKLKSPPDYAADAFVNAFTLIQAADEYAVRKESTVAEFLYKQALNALRVIQSERSDWQPKVVSYRIKALERKLKEFTAQAPSGQSPSPTLPGVKPSTPNEPVPDGWRPFEFNGQKYYFVPLTSAPVKARLP